MISAKKTAVTFWKQNEQMDFICEVDGVLDPHDDAHVLLDDDGLRALAAVLNDALPPLDPLLARTIADVQQEAANDIVLQKLPSVTTKTQRKRKTLDK